MKKSWQVLPVVFGGLILIGTGMFFMTGATSKAASDVVIPAFSPLAAEGKAVFEANCAQCHGRNGLGTGKGPPLLHTIYNPGHHDDGAFYRAAKKGVPQHHWPYGNMPARPGVSDYQISAIVRYIRELQQANGIVYKKHVM